jgi:hypothetical protein
MRRFEKQVDGEIQESVEGMAEFYG